MKTKAIAFMASFAISASASAAILEANPTNFQKVFAAAKGGDTIKMSGTFGATWLMDRSFTTRVTLDATNAVFAETMTIRNVNGMNVIGGTFGSTTESLRILRSVIIDKSSNIKFQSNNFIGNGATTTGFANIGALIKDSSYVQVSVGSFSNLSVGVQVTSSRSVNVNNSKFNTMTSDGIQISDSRFVTAVANHCTGTTPYAGAHPDCIQLWSVAGRPVQSDIFLLRNTVTGDTQGFTSFNPANGGGLRISMIGNIVSTSWVQGLACYACVDSIFSGNIVTTLAGAQWQTAMNIIGGRNNFVSDNTLTPFVGTANSTVNRSLGLVTNSAASAMSQSMTTTIASVPEPAEWAMFIIGFGLVGVFKRGPKPMLQRRPA
jgi:hypothetical protein